jgi:hypothetical protein
MKRVLILAAVAGLIAGPALAQGLIAPSRQYQTPKREGLDKGYGLPTFGTPGDAMAKQQATAAQPQQQQERPAAPFTGLSTFARPDDRPSDTPDFFQKPSGLASTDTGVPNFFENTQDAERPRPRGKLYRETPMSTTDEGMTTGGDTTSGRPRAAVAADD